MTEAQKKSDVQVIESKARRAEDKVMVDARLKITSEKPIKGLTIAFHFLNADGQALATEKVAADDESLDPGEETSVHGEAFNPPGAIRYKIQAYSSGERELRTVNAGPFTIE